MAAKCVNEPTGYVPQFACSRKKSRPMLSLTFALTSILFWKKKKICVNWMTFLKIVKLRTAMETLLADLFDNCMKFVSKITKYIFFV